MAANASRRGTPVDIIDVALLARYLRMLSRKLERRQVMVKDFSVPTFRIVAACTVHAKIRWVWVLLQVTAYTVCWSIFETSQTANADMAVHAADISMLTQKRKGELIVIEPFLREVIRAIVTGATFRAKLVDMSRCKSILFDSMACFTTRGFKVRQSFSVAVRTDKRPAVRKILVRRQTKTKTIVINFKPGNLGQVTLLAAVLGMAFTTVRRLQHPVQAGWITQLALNVCMTVNTTVIHTYTAPWSSVTTLTLGIQFRMGADTAKNLPRSVNCRKRTRAEYLVATEHAQNDYEYQSNASQL